MPRYGDYDDFMAELDRAQLSDDPFGVDLHEELSDEDLKLIGGGRARATKPNARTTTAKPQRKPSRPKP